MRRLIQLLALVLTVLAVPAAAQTYTPFTYYGSVSAPPAATRFVSPLARVEREAAAAYGPFRVLDESTAALVGVTDGRSPAWFEAMLRDYPGISLLRFVECPGTYDDRANLALGRMIRAAGIAAYVPEGGSVRSGAVELVLAGTSLTIDDGAEFAVHAWLDEEGHEATDYAADSPMNRRYLSYYREMGMSEAEAVSFYAMTNSVPFSDARWLDGSEMRRWVGQAQSSSAAARAARQPESPAPLLAPTPALAAVAPVSSLATLPAPAVDAHEQPATPGHTFAAAASLGLAQPLLAFADTPAPHLVPRLAYLDLSLTLF